VCVVKERFEKKYRLPELDKKITKERIVMESRNLARAYKCGVNTPSLLFVDTLNRKIYMDYVDNAAQLKEVFKLAKNPRLIEKIYTQMGENLARMHNSNIIHGDLTTSNMLLKLSSSYQQIDFNIPVEKLLNSGLEEIIELSDFHYFYLIDFGLSYIAAAVEDKAVDLYVLKKAMISVNPRTEEIVMNIFKLV
jgi:TP53 regulating kinase-like protein